MVPRLCSRHLVHDMPLTISPRAGSVQGAPKRSIAKQQPCHTWRSMPVWRGLNSRRCSTLSPHALGDPAPPDWDAEMSIFRKRTLKPSQLETIRHLEEEVDIGKVLFSSDCLAIVEGLNNDAPIGTELRFVSGAAGVLLWRRDDNICYALLVGGSESVSTGDSVQCRIGGMLQVVDETRGPTTKRNYAIFKVPTGDELQGAAVDFVGRPLAGAAPVRQDQLGPSALTPLFNREIPMDGREQIAEALVTGVKALDTLTPLGRGQALLLTGPPGSGKSSLAMDAVLGQAQPCGQPVRCIYAAVGCSEEELRRLTQELGARGAMAYTTVVGAHRGRPLGERYAAVCAAMAMGERIRDGGAHALVVLDDISCMIGMWERITAALAELRPEALTPGSTDGDAPGEEDPEALVEYEGMLVSAAAAQRRRFFSSLIQRAAKVHRRSGGGSLTMLAVLPGSPATGTAVSPASVVAQYKHLSKAQKQKLLAALEVKQKRQTTAESSSLEEGRVRTEVIEEFMSIADGQLVLLAPDQQQPATEQQLTRQNVDAQGSCSRIGSRAFAPAMAELASSIRLELAQAQDASRFGFEGSNAVRQSKQHHAAQMRAALHQPLCQPVPLEDQVVQLYALRRGYCEDVPPEQVNGHLATMLERLKEDYPGILDSIHSSQQLDAGLEEELQSALDQIHCTDHAAVVSQ